MAFYHFFTTPKVDAETGTVSYVRSVFGLFSKREVTIGMEDDWSRLKSKLVINGRRESLKKETAEAVISELEKLGHKEAPMCVNFRWLPFLKPTVLQFGRQQIHFFDKRISPQSIPYSEVTYHTAKLTRKKHHILINEYALNFPEKRVAQISNALYTTIAYEGSLHYDLHFQPRKNYLLLGVKTCYAERKSIDYKDIIYYDTSGLRNKRVDFGALDHFCYKSFKPEFAKELEEFILRKESPLGLEGTVYKSAFLWLNPLSWFRRETVMLTSRGINYRRNVGLIFSKYKTSFIPYKEFSFLGATKFFLWSKLELYGSQNIVSQKQFSYKAIKAIYNKIYSEAPWLQDRTGFRYRTFRWIPFTKKETALIADDNILLKHPSQKIPFNVKGRKLEKIYRERDRGFIGWLFFRHVIITYSGDNIRYDEVSKGFNSLYKLSKEKYQLKDLSDYIPDSDTYPSFYFVIPHMWFRSAAGLVRHLYSARIATPVSLNYYEDEQPATT